MQSETGSTTNGWDTTSDDNRPGDQMSSGVSLLDETLAAAIKDRQMVRPDGSSVARLAEGVSTRLLPTHSDSRGSVVELHDLRWGWHADPIVFVYSFTLRPGYVKGWNLHKLHEDRYVLLQGEMEVVLYDVRTDSPTYGQISKLVLSEFDRRIVNIPRNVWLADHNIGTSDVVAVNFPTMAYEHTDPDKYRLPIGTPLIPHQFADARGW